MNTRTPRDEEISGRRTRRGRAARAIHGELIVGRLVDHGPARPAQANQPCRITCALRRNVVIGNLGVDLEVRSAVTEYSGIGQELVCARWAATRSPCRPLKRDAEAARSDAKSCNTHRNQWSVRAKSFWIGAGDGRRIPRCRVGRSRRHKRFPELEVAICSCRWRALASSSASRVRGRASSCGSLRGHLRSHTFGQALEPVRLSKKHEEPRKRRIATTRRRGD